MNNFTKEELQIIHLDMTIHSNRPPLKESPSHLDLRDKIQSMIDKYSDYKQKCDHEFKLCKCFNGIDEEKYRCTKCLIDYVSNKEIEKHKHA